MNGRKVLLKVPAGIRIALMAGVLAAVPALSAAGTGCETLYRLIEDASYVEGCFDPCDCPLAEPRQLEGTLSLVEILNHGTYVEYAVPYAAFVAPAVEPGGNDVTLDGFGLYTLIQGFAGPALI